MTYVEMILFVSLKAFCCILELFQAKEKNHIKMFSDQRRHLTESHEGQGCNLFIVILQNILSRLSVDLCHKKAILQYRDCYTNDDQFKMSDVLI